MISIKTAGRLLLGLNVALGLAIAAFSFKYLVSPPHVDRLRDIRNIDASATSPGDPTSRTDESVLLTLRNPLSPEKRSPSRIPFQGFTLKGALPAEAPNQGVAFMRAASRPVDLTAHTGGAVLRDGTPDPDFAGWRLADVWKDHALFINQDGERYELHVESLQSGSANSSPISMRQGETYRAEGFKSRLLAASEGREVWGIDPSEVDWAGQNLTLMLDRDLRMMPIPGQGLRIESIESASMAAARGLKPGDLVREVNGRPITSLTELQSLLNDVPRSGVRLTIERTGRTVVLEYRPLPR